VREGREGGERGRGEMEGEREGRKVPTDTTPQVNTG